MRKFILMAILTPIAMFQSFFGLGIFLGIANIRAGVLELPGFSTWQVVLGSLLVLTAINYFAIPLRFGCRTKILFITETLVSPLRFPLQIITDVLTILSYFKNITIVTKIRPSFAAHGLKGTLCIYLLSYYPAGKACQRPNVTQSQQYNQYQNSNNSNQDYARKSGIIHTNFQREIENNLPGSIYIGWNSFERVSAQTNTRGNDAWKVKNITVYNEFGEHRIVINAHISSKTYSSYEMQNVVNTLKSELENSARSTIENLRTQYRGYDYRYNIEIHISSDTTA